MTAPRPKRLTRDDWLSAGTKRLAAAGADSLPLAGPSIALAGFLIGALIIIRPGTDVFSPAAIFPLGALALLYLMAFGPRADDRG